MSKRRQPYITDPKQVYSLELLKLQRSFSYLQQVGEGITEQQVSEWRQVEYLRHFNFILEEAIQVGEVLVNGVKK